MACAGQHDHVVDAARKLRLVSTIKREHRLGVDRQLDVEMRDRLLGLQERLGDRLAHAGHRPPHRRARRSRPRRGFRGRERHIRRKDAPARPAASGDRVQVDAAFAGQLARRGRGFHPAAVGDDHRGEHWWRSATSGTRRCGNRRCGNRRSWQPDRGSRSTTTGEEGVHVGVILGQVGDGLEHGQRAALGQDDAGQSPRVGRLDVHGGLVGLDLEDHVALLDPRSGLDVPLQDRAFLHGLAGLGHQDRDNPAGRNGTRRGGGIGGDEGTRGDLGQRRMHEHRRADGRPDRAQGPGRGRLDLEQALFRLDLDQHIARRDRRAGRFEPPADRPRPHRLARLGQLDCGHDGTFVSGHGPRAKDPLLPTSRPILARV